MKASIDCHITLQLFTWYVCKNAISFILKGDVTINGDFLSFIHVSLQLIAVKDTPITRCLHSDLTTLCAMIGQIQSVIFWEF